MSQSTWVSHTIWEGTSLKVMARVRDVNGDLITQASVTSIQYRSVEGQATETVALTALTVADVVFDTLQKPSDDATWKVDPTGYNFKTVLPPATFPNGDVTYNVPIEFTDSAGEKAVLGLEVPARETYIDTPA